jgi:hypothetical protein
MPGSDISCNMDEQDSNNLRHSSYLKPRVLDANYASNKCDEAHDSYEYHNIILFILVVVEEVS